MTMVLVTYSLGPRNRHDGRHDVPKLAAIFSL